MEKTTAIIQAAFAMIVLLWAAFMVVRLLAGGYHAFYVACFGLIALLGGNLLRVSIKEMKGGKE